MEEKLEEQVQIGQELRKILSALKKDGSARKTEEYFKKKSMAAADLLNNFEENHNELLQSLDKEHSYFKQDLPGQISKCYQEITNYINTWPKSNPMSEEVSYKHPDLLQLQIKLNLFNQEMQRAEDKIKTKQHPKIYNFLEENLTRLWRDIESLHEKLLTINHEEVTKYQKSGVYDEFKSRYNDIIEDIITASPLENSSQNKTISINLPRINIPIFNGDYETWITFRDIFIQTIHDNHELGDAERMQYLKGQTRGEAAKLIQHLEVSARNYPIAWELIKRRYNNNRLLFNKYADNILNLPCLQQESAASIKRLHDTVQENLRAIENMGITAEQLGSRIIAHMLLKKLDNDSRKLYEQSTVAHKDVQELPDLLEFLENRFQSLEALRGTIKKSEHQQTGQRPRIYNYHSDVRSCKLCGSDHEIYRCQKFKEMSVKERNAFIKKNNLCKNCMRHPTNTKCLSKTLCFKCNRPHHTYLHWDHNPNTKTNTDQQRTSEAKHNTARNQGAPHCPKQGNEIESHLGRTSNNDERPSIPLLATAFVNVSNNRGYYELMRVLIDPGSQVSFITEGAANTLGVPRVKHQATITGLGSCDAGISKWKIHAQMKPRFSSNFKAQAELYVLPKLTSSMPPSPIEVDEHWNSIILADPTYYKPGKIDILLGIDLYKDILLNGIKKSKAGLLAQNTELGWILSGSTLPGPQFQINSMIITAEQENQIAKFWEIEEADAQRNNTDQDNICDEFFEKSHTRNQDGTYTVRLPFRENEQSLGQSKKTAVARLLQMEKKFMKDKKLETMYKEFMEEYLQLNHMRPAAQITNKTRYFIPHQAVIKEDRETTKLRVVFDASQKTSTGISLNDILHTGPKLQQDLIDILLRWRKYKIGMTADVEKMYRQVKLHEDDQRFHTILWRFNRNDPIQEYQLTTVTYGTSPAAYLAIRTMHQLAKDESQEFPTAARLILEDFYVDDFLSGAHNKEEAQRIKQEVQELLSKGGFNIRKWKCNLSLDEDTSLQEIGSHGDTTKILGIGWLPQSDNFHYSIKQTAIQTNTKRQVLSEIASIFDPLGLMAPVVIKAKLIMQEIWKSDKKWDEEIPTEVQATWDKFKDELPIIENLQLPRWFRYNPELPIELHGFCDASQRAYGAVIYAKTIEENHVHTTLLVAKTKVAPIKNKMTIPQLELCAATLLAKLMKRTVTALKIAGVKTYTWSDSKVVLAWLYKTPSKQSVFIINRVNEVHRQLGQVQWNYVKSEDNPADLLSRGAFPSKLQKNPLWWNGPLWLQAPTLEIQWAQEFSNEIILKNENLEEKTVVTTIIHEPFELITKFSSWKKTLQVMAYCNRFIDRCKTSNTIESTQTALPSFITPDEIQRAKLTLIKLVQREYFYEALTRLNNNLTVDKNSHLKNLDPYVDEHGVLRVGGRLKNSSLNFNQRHPIILPTKCHLTDLIIRNAHHETLHGGTQLTLTHIRQEFWIPRGKNKVKTIIRQCVVCTRFRSTTCLQKMGNLPRERVTPSHPFTNVGIDYAGPIQMRLSRGRGSKCYKGYISIFICLATKAIHLEAVSDLSTDAFIAAFRRFTSRRGLCSAIFSDNGTNFVGAQRVLDRELQQSIDENSIEKALAKESIKWHRIPPGSPHFGGLWEAGVKSMKFHLRRIVGDHKLTFEEMSTLLCQIEACLNSRPLTPLTEDPQELDVLTPGHFLIGKSLKTIPEPEINGNNSTLQDRWRLIQKLKQNFWTKWTSEYLSRLQYRSKWTDKKENIQEGDIVLIKQDNINPNSWPLGRVTQSHPGNDGFVRVATIRCKDGKEIKRPITKLCKLPVEQEERRNDKTNKVGSTPKSGLIQTLMMVMLLCVANTKNATAHHTIHQLPPGFYVEHLGKAYINGGELKLSTPFSLDQLKLDRSNLNKTVENFRGLCNAASQLLQNNHCHEFQHHIAEMKYENNLLIDSIQHLSSRSKRGILGELMTSIFGVNDEVYHDIDDLQENQQHIIEVTNHQRKLMISTMNDVRQIEEKINQKLEHFRVKFNKGIAIINEMHLWYKQVDENTINLQIIQNYQLAVNYLKEVNNKYTKIMNICHGQGHITDLLSPSELAKLIQKAETTIPSDMHILLKPVSRMEVFHDANELRIVTFFFIIQRQNYDIIKVFPVPVKKTENLFIAPKVSNDLLAVEYNSQKYFEINEQEVKEAVKLREGLYIYNPGVVKNMEQHPNCIIQSIYQKNGKFDCELSSIQVQDVLWKELIKPNTWMFISNQPATISKLCGGKREEITINGTGTIHIGSDCLLKTQNIILRARFTNEMKSTTTFSKPIPLNLWQRKLNHLPFNENLIEPEKGMENISAKLTNEIMEEKESNSHIWRHFSHPLATTTVIGISAIATLAVTYLWMRYIQPLLRSRGTSRSTTAINETEAEIPLTEIAPRPKPRQRIFDLDQLYAEATTRF